MGICGNCDGFWLRHISLDAHPDILSRLSASMRGNGDGDEPGCAVMQTITAVLAYVLALPMPRRLYVLDWLCNGRTITRQMRRDYGRNHAALAAEITASGIEAFLKTLGDNDEKRGY